MRKRGEVFVELLLVLFWYHVYPFSCSCPMLWFIVITHCIMFLVVGGLKGWKTFFAYCYTLLYLSYMHSYDLLIIAISLW